MMWVDRCTSMGGHSIFNGILLEAEWNVEVPLCFSMIQFRPSIPLPTRTIFSLEGIFHVQVCAL